MAVVRIVQLRERDLVDASSLANKAGIELDAARRLIGLLSDRGIIKPANVPDAEESDSSNEYEGSFAEGTYRIVYVGVVVAGEIVVYCVPKYLHTRVEPSELRPVFSALRKYHSDTEDANVTMLDESIRSNRISLILALLANYEEHGLYTNQERIQQTNGRGAIHWPSTISMHLPVIEDERPLYMDYETVVSRTDDSDFVSRLHQAVLSSCSSELESCGLLDVFSLSPVDLSDTPLDDFGDTDAIVRKLDQELSVQFITWKQDVLKLMKVYFEDERTDEEESGITCYGTNSFHVIWEKACKSAFNDMLDKKLRELPIQLKGRWLQRAEETLLGIIPSPRWRVVSSSGVLVDCEPTDTLIPDIVTMTTSAGRPDEFAIYDAKYYDPSFGKKIVAAPGVESVTKQLLYQSAYRDFITDNEFSHIRNVFLIPTDGNVFVPKGDVSFEVVADEGEPFTQFIDVILAPANLLLECYSAQRRLTAEELPTRS